MRYFAINKILYYYSSIILLIICSTFLWSQEKNYDDISTYSSNPLKLYTNKDGLPQSSVIATAIDSIGRFWVGTQDGAAVYNAREWKIINMPEQSSSNYIQSIKVTSDSAIWFGILRGGVAKLYKEKWNFYDIKDGLPSSYIITIAEEITQTKESIVWVGTNKGVARKVGNKWEIISVDSEKGLAGNIVYGIYQSSDGAMWFATNKGVSKYSNGKWEILALPSELSGMQIYKVFQTMDNSLWFGSNGRIGKFNGKNWQTFHLEGKTTSNVINSIHQNKNGTVWIGSMRGLWKINLLKNNTYSFPEFINFTTGTGNNGNLVWSISETSDGNLWFGTSFALIRYTEGKWKGLTEKMGIEQGGTTAIIQTRNGDYYFGTDSGLLRFSSGKFETIKNISGSILYLFEDQEGALWVSVFFEGVYRFKNNAWKKYQKKDGLADNSNWFIYQSLDKSIWFGSDAGVSKLVNEKFKIYTMADGLNDNTILCMYESMDSTLWCGTTNGVAVLKDGSWENFSSDNKLSGIAVNDIYGYNFGEKNEETIWLATLGNGIYEYELKTKSLNNYNATQPPYISNNSVYRIEEDKFKKLYFLTNNKITRFTFINNDEILSEKFGIEDGLPNDEGISSASFVDSKGRLWFGTTEGATYFDPNLEVIDTVSRPLIIERIDVENYNSGINIAENINLDYTQNTIAFEFALLSYFKETENLYSFQLVGFDDKRSNWTSDYKKEYSKLPTGNYVFYIWGKDYGDKISGPVKFEFSILPPWWQTAWFRILMFVFFASIIYLIIRFYISQKIKKRVAELEKKNIIEKERSRISRDMHDSIGSNLTRVAILSDRIEKDINTGTMDTNIVGDIKKRIKSIGQISRENIDSMNEIIWSLSPKYDTVNSLIFYMNHYLNEMFENSSTKYIFDFPEIIKDITLTPEIRRNIFLIFKEAINNLAKHSQATSVLVTLKVNEFNLEFVIEDNGIGFFESNPYANENMPGFGLDNMKIRANSVNADLSIKSSSGKGTIVRFSILLNS
jgi:ligand-binding sensor domain-containing protein/signal transduction histidine kinase